MAGEKTEKATSKKRNDERKKGNVFKSQDIITVVSLLGCFYALNVFAPFIVETVQNFLKEYISHIGEIDSLSNEEIIRIQNEIILASAKTTLPLLLVAVALAVISTGVQTKFIFSKKSMEIKFSRIDPIQGFMKLFSIKNVVELIKNLIKITLLIYLIYDFMKDRMIEIPRTMSMELEVSLRYIMLEIIELLKLVCMWFTAIAGFDYLYQRWDYERQIKMSKQEIKEEYKQMEGDPQIKARIRDLQKQRARNRMMQAVPTADVVIRNPTHFAVALRYDTKIDNAPVLVAKGQDELALKIVAVAEENHVYVMENKPLARTIYATTNLNQEISPELYGTIAEILVYIYKLNHKELDT